MSLSKSRDVYFTDCNSDPLLIDATMNSLAILLKTRPVVQAKILQVILNYNPLRAAGGPMTPRMVVVIKSLQRTTRALLRFVMRILPQHPLAEKIDIYLRRLQSNTTAVFAQAQSLKRPADTQDELDPSKRQKLEPRRYPPLPPPPVTYAQLFTLTDLQDFAQFNVRDLPEELGCSIASALMQHIDSKSLDEAIDVVQQRLQKLQDAAEKSALAGADEDDDYDPEALSGVDQARLGAVQQPANALPEPTLDLGPFELPKPDPLRGDELKTLSMQTVAHVWETALSSQPSSSVVKQKLGINRLAGSSNDKESWLTLMIRLATRATAGLEHVIRHEANDDADETDSEDGQPLMPLNVPDEIRQQLFDYVLDDWKHRLSLGITWLTEEWYADKVQAVGIVNGNAATTKSSGATQHYDYWVSKLFSTLIPRFDKDDHRILIRFLSELPSLDRSILSHVKTLTDDPATVDICKKSLQYLYLMRPPVREVVVDTLQDIWREGDEDVKAVMAPLLQKWRPGFAQQDGQTKKEAEDTRTFPNGIKAENVGQGALAEVASAGA